MKNRLLAFTACWFAALLALVPPVAPRTDAAGVVVNSFRFGFNAAGIAGCKLWLKADSESYADGANVTTATDRSGLGQNFTQGTATQYPLFETNEANGLPVYRFDGVNDSLTSGLAVSSFIASNAWTVFAVKKWTALGADAGEEVNRTLLADSGGYWGISAYTGNEQGFVYDAAYKATTRTTDATTFHVMEFRHDGSNIISSVDGGAEDTVACGTVDSVTGTLRIGLNYLGAVFFQGDLCELIIYNVDVSSGERAAVRAYLKAKWGTP